MSIYSVKDKCHRENRQFIPQLLLDGKIVTITDIELSDSINFCALVFNKSMAEQARKAKDRLDRFGVNVKIEGLSRENAFALIITDEDPMKIAVILGLDKTSTKVLKQLDYNRVFETKTTWAKSEIKTNKEQNCRSV